MLVKGYNGEGYLSTLLQFIVTTVARVIIRREKSEGGGANPIVTVTTFICPPDLFLPSTSAFPTYLRSEGLFKPRSWIFLAVFSEKIQVRRISRAVRTRKMGGNSGATGEPLE